MTYEFDFSSVANLHESYEELFAEEFGAHIIAPEVAGMRPFDYQPNLDDYEYQQMRYGY